ncbi:MAG: HD domain-containing protein [Candidatus Moranbacteria bacterium]|nr:HD domain-containing protein [Candidatus Moranbacteria bacterium]
MITKKIIKEIEGEAKKYFEDANGCHDWDHVERVRNVALRIGKKEKADLGILELAVLLHDVERNNEMNEGRKEGCRVKFCHALEGGKIARNILKKYKLKDEDIENIVHCVESHRFRNELKPKTIEAKCLYDADKIDGIGAVGIGRDFLFAGSHGSRCLYTGNEKEIAKSGKDYSYTKEDSAVLEYEIKLKHTYKKMLTKSGKKFAKERSDFMKEFFKRFWEEVEGKK